MYRYRNVRGVRPVAHFARRIRTCVIVLGSVCLLGALPARAGEELGVALIGGVARDASSGKPIGDVRVVAHNLSNNADQATLTGADGIFTFTNLEPGRYEIAAAKEGFQKSAARVEVAPRRTARFDLTLAADIPGTATQRNQTSTEDEKKLLLDRLE